MGIVIMVVSLAIIGGGWWMYYSRKPSRKNGTGRSGGSGTRRGSDESR